MYRNYFQKEKLLKQVYSRKDWCTEEENRRDECESLKDEEP